METCDHPIKLGSILFTMVEPTKGREVDYNRWYERDHLYSGVMIGPYSLAAGRFVATRDLKDLRYPNESEVTSGPSARGSYLALYWVLANHHEDWNRWAVKQVNVLHENGRMFAERDHVHTLLYTYDWAAPRDPDGVPPELALDHPYAGLAAVIGEAATSREEFDGVLKNEVLPELLDGSPISQCLSFSPLPLLIDAPGDVPRTPPSETRFLHLYFLDEHPGQSWEKTFATLPERFGNQATVIWASPFIPTIPGTDAYTDQLW